MSVSSVVNAARAVSDRGAVECSRVGLQRRERRARRYRSARRRRAGCGDRNALVPAYYLIGAALLGPIAVTGLRETSARPLDGSFPNVATRDEAAALLAGQDRDERLDVDRMPLPSVPYLRVDGVAEVALRPDDPRVVRAAAAAGITVCAEDQVGAAADEDGRIAR